MEVNKIKPVKVDFAIMDPTEVEKVLKKRIKAKKLIYSLFNGWKTRKIINYQVKMLTT